MTQPYHPTCGKRFPGGAQAGHCAVCCETFIGNTAFEAHRVGDWDNRRCEIQPYTIESMQNGAIRYGHWQDDKGHWHHGKRLTEEQKATMWPRTIDGLTWTWRDGYWRSEVIDGETLIRTHEQLEAMK